MLGYDRIRAAAKVAKEKAKSLADTVKGMEESLQSQAPLASAIEMARAEAAKADEARRLAEDQLNEARRKAEGAAERFEKAKQAHELIIKMHERRVLGKTLRKQMDDAKAQVEKLTESVKRREELREAAQRFEEAERRYSELLRMTKEGDRRKTIEAGITAGKARLAKLTEEINALLRTGIEGAAHEEAVRNAERTAEAARMALTKQDDRRRAAESELERARVLHEQLRNACEELERFIASGKCPTCGQDWPNDRIFELEKRKEEEKYTAAEVERLNKALIQILSDTSEAKSAEDAADIAKRRLEEINAGRSELQRRETERIELQDKIHSDEASVVNLPLPPDPAEIEIYDRVIAENRAAAKEYDSLVKVEELLKSTRNEFEGARLAFEQEKHEQSLAEARLLELGYEIGAKAKAEAEQDTAQQLIQNVKDCEAEFRTAEKWLQEKQKALRSAEMAYENYCQQKSRAEEMQRQAKLYTETSSALTDLREALNQRTKPLLEQLASDNLAELSGERYTQLKLNDKYEARLIDDGIEKQVISGGEEDIVALSLRLALAQLIQERSGQPMSLLILDEVFGSLDIERRTNVLTQLNALRDMFEQVILISHIEAINEAADRCLIVTYDPTKREGAVTEALAEAQLAV